MIKKITVISTLLFFAAASAHAQGGIPSDTSNDMEKGSANPVANNTPINNNDAIEGDTPKPNAQLPVSADEKAGTVPATTQTHHHRHRKHKDDTNGNAADANSAGADR